MIPRQLDRRQHFNENITVTETSQKFSSHQQKYQRQSHLYPRAINIRFNENKITMELNRDRQLQPRKNLPL